MKRCALVLAIAAGAVAIAMVCASPPTFAVASQTDSPEYVSTAPQTISGTIDMTAQLADITSKTTELNTIATLETGQHAVVTAEITAAFDGDRREFQEAAQYIWPTSASVVDNEASQPAKYDAWAASSVETIGPHQKVAQYIKPMPAPGATWA